MLDQTAGIPGSTISDTPPGEGASMHKHYAPIKSSHPAYHRNIHGIELRVIKFFLWVNILIVSITKYKNPFLAIKRLKQLVKLKDNYREENKLIKYASVGKRYYFSYNSPGWPSKSFNRYIKHQLSRFDTNTSVTLHTLVFGITKKCGFKCEHCFEWSNLNQPETLSKEDVTKILRNFSDHGVSMVQITGGEPLNRFNEIIEILPLFSGIDFWIYTSGYHLTDGKARLLKKTGLTGVTISLDHWIPELHDAFRGKQGSFKWVEKAANNIIANKLALCLSICATNNFISEDNLYQYLELAKKLNASFVQILEPKAVGHYAGKDVMLSTSNIEILDVFYKNVNFNSKYLDYPSVVYHGFYSRRLGCSGAGKDYLYVDMDGWVHDCPFCQKKIFNALTGEITKQVEAMRTFGCSVFNSADKI